MGATTMFPEGNIVLVETNVLFITTPFKVSGTR
jgi:hypothetical protein